MTNIAGYRRPTPGTQPNHLHPQYLSSLKRAPTKPLVYLPHTISEATGPVFGEETVGLALFDLTRQASGEPSGERIVVSGRVLDQDGRPVPHTLVGICMSGISTTRPSTLTSRAPAVR
jgi:protocatechuate 3,4-dioxygenase beta subunit